MNVKILVYFAFIASALASCRELDIEYSLLHDADSESATIQITSNNVSIEDVRSLHKNSSVGTRSSVDIDCICDEANDTLLYVYNKPEGGWVIYSSDKRVPPIVAESDSGSFNDLIKNESAKCWVKSMAFDLKMIKVLNNDQLNFSAAEINSNESFWRPIELDHVSSIDHLNVENGTSINGIIDTPPIQIIPSGHYEYKSSSYFTEAYDSIPRMITTNWHQDNPYNKFCPDRTDKPDFKAPAGCAPIAVGQMLFFLHNKYGIPKTAPSKAYCNGNINNYQWAQTDYTADVWDEMKLHGIAAAPLIADLGRRMEIVYGNESSPCKKDNLLSKAFADYGINVTNATYNAELVKENLLLGLPVLITAYSSSINQSQNGGINISQSNNIDQGNGDGAHCFIVDRYKRMRIRIESHYSWVYDESPNIGISICVPDSIVVSYLDPKIEMIGMNWGWGMVFNKNSEWYALTGDWIKVTFEHTYNFNNDRRMIYVKSINFN